MRAAATGRCPASGSRLNQAGTEQVFDHDKDGKPIPLYNPLTGKHDIMFKSKKLFYRTPTLVSIWATAPYLHNNSVGIYNGDPSLAGRMAAYEDGMTKLLSPELRLGVGSMLVTTQDSKLPDFFPMLQKADAGVRGAAGPGPRPHQRPQGHARQPDHEPARQGREGRVAGLRGRRLAGSAQREVRRATEQRITPWAIRS